MLQPRFVNLNALLNELRKLMAPLIGEDIDLIFAPGRELDLVKIDPGQFEQAVINLVVNARDAMPDGGRLIIETRNVELGEDDTTRQRDVRPGGYVLVAVTDTGLGIDPATKARIFDPFFTTKGPGKGTGLGLAMVYGFVKQSGGHVEVYSEPGHGTAFKVYLPRAEQGAAATRTAAANVEVPKGKETVLLVEDEAGVRHLSKFVLESNGYTVLEAGARSGGARRRGATRWRDPSAGHRRGDARDERPSARQRAVSGAARHARAVHVGLHRRGRPPSRRDGRQPVVPPETIQPDRPGPQGPRSPRRREGLKYAARAADTSRVGEDRC